MLAGHTKKQLEKYAKMKTFSQKFKEKHCKKFPQVKMVTCHCKSHHKSNCGCLSDAFIEKARTNFSCLLSQPNSAEEFATKLKALAMHAKDKHKWDGGQCDFHPMRVCSCGKCKTEALECEGKDYKSKISLKCPLHALAYEIECEYWSSMAADLVHPVLKRGHSNWLEASHNVLIRFRPKHTYLDRLHYELSTNLGLLQSNMTYIYKKLGPKYHWISDLYQRLKLPMYDGLEEVLEATNRNRKTRLDDLKREEKKKGVLS